jgi:PKD repeat protein
VSFTIVVAPLGASIERYEWDFGDGTPATTSGGTISHLYGSKGTKTINVTVVPTVGATLNDQMQIQIN